MEHREENNYLEEIKPVVEGLGYSLVELKSGSRAGALHFEVVIYKNDGISIEDCTTVHRTLFARLEIIEDSRNINLEVSSPGMGRKIKNIEEFIIFIGKPVKVLLFDNSDWIKGIIKSAKDDKLTLETGIGNTVIPYTEIKKATLE